MIDEGCDGPLLILNKKVNDNKFKGTEIVDNCVQPCKLREGKYKDKFVDEH